VGERVFVANNAASGFDGASELTVSVWANPFVSGKVALGNLVTIDPAPTEAGANSAETKIAIELGQAKVADNTTSILQLSVNGKLVAPESTTRANTTDAWIHYVVTLKNTVTSTSLQFYVNGVLKDQGMVDGKIPPFRAPRITLGGTPGFYAYNRYLDEIAIYRRALNAVEIAALYVTPAPANCP
jgi:Concanavalin A-like lectin/glucanases superfamily